MNPNQFYALPQSPQTLKQLLMVAGYDKYFQIVRCFRDEDLRADRQPEFTQIDCEMSFVEQEDVLEVFERWAKHMFHEVLGLDFREPLRRMPWIEAMEKYGSDKPDLRFGMEFSDLTDLAKGHGFSVFDEAEYVTGFAATGCATYTRKQIDALTEYVKRPQVGAKGLIWIRVEENGTKSSIDKFYTPDEVRAMADRCGAKAGDMVFILCGKKFKALTQLCALRLEVAQQLGLRDPKKFAPLWVVDFPMFGTTPSPRPNPRTCSTSKAILAACAPTPTTSSATARRSAAARSVSTTPNCRRRYSSAWASRPSGRRSSSAS